MLWASRGISQTNDAAFIVAEYNARRTLAKMGYRFDPDELTDFDVDCFMLIEQELDKRESDKLKGRGKRRG